VEKKLFIPIVLGTNREGRRSEPVARLLLETLQQREGVETQLFDVRDFKFPQDGYGQDIKDQFPEWRDAVVKADGLILVIPEYNHGYPGTLKALLDVLLPEYNHKAVGLVGVSMGPFGGSRGIEAIIPVMRELGLVATSTDLQFQRVQGLFDEKGNLKEEAYKERISRFLDELEWMAQTLQWGRENISSEE
jgi:NAD(P)H-dependent FMN reductase